MAKQGIKTERLAVELNVVEAAVIIKHEKRNGEKFEAATSASYSLKALPASIQAQVALYGLNKLLQDRTSQYREHGIVATLEAIESVYAVLAGGEWSAKRKAGEKAANDDAVLIAVLADQLKKPVAVVAVMFAKLPADQKKGLAAKYADQVAEAKAAAEDDASDFFAEM